MDGVLVVDKPRGMTSHDVVRAIRKKLNSRAVGHAGTLDPMATGVLVVAVGEATKLVPYLTAANKEYEARIALGETTETLDADGTEKTTAPIPDGWRSKLDAALDVERRRRSQIPPNFSAIHVQGQRAHELARRGETVELEPRAVEVLSLDVVRASDEPLHLDVRLAVSKGYYVRSLARDLAATLGTVAHLTALRRVRSGPFTVGEATALDDPELASRMLSVTEAATRSLPTVTLDEAQARDARHGKTVYFTGIETSGDCAWLDERRALVAVGHVDEQRAGRVLRGFNLDASKPARD